MHAHSIHLSSKIFPMVRRTSQFNEFWLLQLFSKDLIVHWDFNSPSGNPHGSVWVHSSHLPTLSGAWNVIHGLHSQLAPLQAKALVASPRLKSWQTSTWVCSFNWIEEASLFSICHFNTFNSWAIAKLGSIGIHMGLFVIRSMGASKHPLHLWSESRSLFDHFPPQYTH
jgi:hypothetical protein